MITRSTFGHFNVVSEMLQRSAQRLEDAQLDAATLDRLRRPSAHPTDASRAVRLQDQVDAHEAVIERLELSATELSVAESALAEAGNLLVRARELATTYASESYNTEDRALASAEVESLMASLVSTANTDFAGTYVFSGTAVDTEPFLADGTYVGSTQVRSVPLLGSGTLDMGLTGDQIFDAAGSDPFDAMEDLRVALANDDTAGIQAAMTSLEAAHDGLIASRLTYGLAVARAEDLVQVSEDAAAVCETYLGQLVELDATDAFSTLAQVQTVYEAAATTLAQTLNQSIFDYL